MEQTEPLQRSHTDPDPGGAGRCSYIWSVRIDERQGEMFPLTARPVTLTETFHARFHRSQSSHLRRTKLYPPPFMHRPLFKGIGFKLNPSGGVAWSSPPVLKHDIHTRGTRSRETGCLPDVLLCRRQSHGQRNDDTVTQYLQDIIGGSCFSVRSTTLNRVWVFRNGSSASLFYGAEPGRTLS